MTVPAPEGRTSPRGLIRTFGPYALPHWPGIAGAGLMVLAGTAVGLLEPWPLKFLFDDVLIHPRSGGHAKALLVAIVGAIIGIAALGSLFGYLRQYLLNAAGQKVAFSMRAAIYEQIQRLPLSFHDRQQTGDLITTVTKDVDKVQELITDAAVEAGSNALTLVGMVGVMLALDWQLAIVTMAIIPLLSISLRRYRGTVKAAERHIRRKEGDIASLTQETLTSIRLVKVFGRERYETDRFRTHTEEALGANLRISRIEAAFGSFLNMLTALALGGLVWFGSLQVLSGRLTPGELIIFVSYLKDFYSPVRALSKLAGSVGRARVRAEKIIGLLNEPEAVADGPDAIPAPALEGHVRFEGVTFSYLPEQPVLRDVDFEVLPGQVAALVGATGAGKSTIAALLPRLYDPEEGRVVVDGHDIRDLQLASYRPQVSLVLQSSLLFHASIRENIAYGRPDATMDEIVEAARVANIHDYIEALPDGYDTVVGERGDTVSGGQRQRIAIARAVVRDAPVLLLDEPTSGLDARSERLVLDALDRLMTGRTTIVIAHRLSTVRRADLILVVDGGRIVERGTHDQLLALDGRYAELHRLQEGPPNGVSATAGVGDT
jgi:ATP-binding cassette subfamily B protein